MKLRHIVGAMTLGAIVPGLNARSENKSDNKLDGYNVIYILADDLGYGDVGCYGQKKIETPNIDRLAQQGMLFTDHYSGTSVSAPSRASLMTGLHTGHTFIRGNLGGVGYGALEGQHPLPAGTYTLGRMFQDAGYTTGAFGKWGLGHPGSEGDPTQQGFDEFYGYNCQALAHKYYQEYIWHNRDTVWMPGNNLIDRVHYVPDTIHSMALQFIRDNKSNKFFAFLPYILPHAELMPPEDDLMAKYRGRFDEKPYVRKNNIGDYSEVGRSTHRYCSQPEPYTAFAATVSRLDRYVGDVMALVDSLGIREKTLIIFTSDNGPHREGGANPRYFESNGPFRGFKKDLYEGGVRVPFIASCPGTIAQGVESGHISTFWDMLPTMAEITGTDLPVATDGLSMMPTLLGHDGQREHDYLYWEFHEQGGKQAVRWGKWKGLKLNAKDDPDAKIQLFDLSTDIHEDHDVAAEHPEVVARIAEMMRQSHTPSQLFPLGYADTPANN